MKNHFAATLVSLAAAISASAVTTDAMAAHRHHAAGSAHHHAARKTTRKADRKVAKSAREAAPAAALAEAPATDEAMTRNADLCFSAAAKAGRSADISAETYAASGATGSCTIVVTRGADKRLADIHMKWAHGENKVTFDRMLSGTGQGASGYTMSYELDREGQAPKIARETAGQSPSPKPDMIDDAFTQHYMSKFDAYRPQPVVATASASAQP